VRADRLQRLFSKDVLQDYDFSQSPELVTKSRDSATLGFTHSEHARWQKAQESFLRWTIQTSVFTQEYIESSYKMIGSFFDKRGLFAGTVLDIGGGWGLFREWWDAGNSDIYVVHDPGVARFLRGPYEYHRELYQRGFLLPMSFVEGYGEKLPYVDNSFDVCLIAATLDHVIAPERVLREIHRCVKPRGNLILIQTTKIPPKNLFRSLTSSAGRMYGNLHSRLVLADHHLNTFFLDDLVSLLSRNCFTITALCRLHDINPTYAIEARAEA
jgi:SAM-dependent methyltransferase